MLSCKRTINMFMMLKSVRVYNCYEYCSCLIQDNENSKKFEENLTTGVKIWFQDTHL